MTGRTSVDEKTSVKQTKNNQIMVGDALGEFDNLVNDFDVADLTRDEAQRIVLMRDFDRAFFILKTKVREEKGDEFRKVLQQMLSWEDKVGRLNHHGAEWYELNAMDEADCTDKCQYYRKISAGRFSNAVVGESYAYSKGEWKPHPINQNKQVRVYSIFLKKITTGEEQIGRELQRKIERNQPISESDYVEDRIDSDRIYLNQSEFVKYFRDIK